MIQRQTSSQRRNPCWSSSSLRDRQDDGAMPLHHLTGRDPPPLTASQQSLLTVTDISH